MDYGFRIVKNRIVVASVKVIRKYRKMLKSTVFYLKNWILDVLKGLGGN